MFETSNAKRVKRSRLFNDDDSSHPSRGSSRSASPSKGGTASDSEVVKPDYGFEYDFITAQPAAPSTSETVSSKPQQTKPSSGQEEEPEEPEEEEYQFRLFNSGPPKSTSQTSPGRDASTTAAANLRIRLSRTPDPAPLTEEVSLENTHFVQPNRSDTYYFTSALPQETLQGLKSQYADVAVSTSDVLSRAESTPWPGTSMPWRLVHIKVDRQETKPASNVKQSSQIPAAAVKRLIPSRSRPSKKRRIILRSRLALRAERAAQAKEAEKTEREKRTRRNREKKVKRKEREKRKKMGSSEGGGVGGTVGDDDDDDDDDEDESEKEDSTSTLKPPISSNRNVDTMAASSSPAQAQALPSTTRAPPPPPPKAIKSSSTAPTRRAPTARS